MVSRDTRRRPFYWCRLRAHETMMLFGPRFVGNLITRHALCFCFTSSLTQNKRQMMMLTMTAIRLFHFSRHLQFFRGRFVEISFPLTEVKVFSFTLILLSHAFRSRLLLLPYTRKTSLRRAWLGVKRNFELRLFSAAWNSRQIPSLVSSIFIIFLNTLLRARITRMKIYAHLIQSSVFISSV